MKKLHLNEYLKLDRYNKEILNNIACSKRPKIYDNLILSAIGGRICYSSEHPLLMLINDKRIIDKEERINFLKRLSRSGHYSPFAHSPIFTCYFSHASLNLPFKVFSYPVYEHNEENNEYEYKTYICANVRHIMEYIEDKEQFFNSIKEIDNNQLILYLLFNESTIYKINFDIDNKKDEIINLIKNIIEVNDLTKLRCIAFYIDNSPFDWFSFIFTNISRACANQWVRHTWQNFNQRSHRYTEADNMIIVPPKIDEDEEARELYTKTFTNILNTYYKLIADYGIRKEDARYIIPMGVNTTMISSGPRFVFEDFVNKRNIKEAQYEIRNIAKTIGEVLDLTLEK